MAEQQRIRRADFAGLVPEEARAAIADILAIEPGATRKVYAGLAHKVWTLLIERRLDGEVRDWHGLLLAVRGAIRASDDAGAERLTALADLLRESLSLAETSPLREIAARPHARRILDRLAAEDGFLARQALLTELGLGTSHLSNVLMPLVAHGLIDRRDRGKHAEFALTALGREILEHRKQHEDEADRAARELMRRLADQPERDEIADPKPAPPVPPPPRAARTYGGNIITFRPSTGATRDTDGGDPVETGMSQRSAAIMPRTRVSSYS